MSSVLRNNIHNSREVIPGLVINGTPWSDRRGRGWHKACWNIKARDEPIVGIADEFNLAGGVKCEETSQAVVKLTLNLPLHQKLLAFQGSRTIRSFFL